MDKNSAADASARCWLRLASLLDIEANVTGDDSLRVWSDYATRLFIEKT